MLKTLQKYWKIAGFVFMVASAAVSFYTWRVEAADTEQKVQTFEQTFKNIEQIAQSLQDPNTWLRQYLINHAVDSAVARIWASYPKGPVVDTSGKALSGIPYLDPVWLPERGVYKMIKADGTEIVIDSALWLFPRNVK